MPSTVNVVLSDDDHERISDKKERLGLTWEEYLLLTVEEPERLVEADK